MLFTYSIELFLYFFTFLQFPSLLHLGFDNSCRNNVVFGGNLKLSFFVFEFFQLLLDILLLLLFCHILKLALEHRSWNYVVFYLRFFFLMGFLLILWFFSFGGFFKIFELSW